MLTGVLTVTLPFLAIAWWLRWAAFVSADNADAGSVEEHCVHAHLAGNDHEWIRAGSGGKCVCRISRSIHDMVFDGPACSFADGTIHRCFSPFVPPVLNFLMVVWR